MKYFIALVFMISLTRLYSQDAPSPNKISYRPPTVAGSFYPKDADTLRSWIEEYLAKGQKENIENDIFALIAPHAGYVYSGWIAGLAYKQVAGRYYDAVIIIAPSHTKAFKGASVFSGDAYVTPLGEAIVDNELSLEIASNNKIVNMSMKGHEWEGSRTEHSLEVQIPFIQIALPKTKIVPIIMGSQNNETTDALLKAIVTSVRKLKRKVLIVASSDLSHFYPADKAKRMDQQITRAFYRYDYFKLALNLFSRKWEACGGGPIVVAMMAAEQLGATKAKPIIYSNSASSPYIDGDRKKVVGYFSGIMYDDNSDSDILPKLSDENKQKLLNHARETVISLASNNIEEYKISQIPKELSDEYAVFVTLHKNGRLRGCMGETIAKNMLVIAVEESAKQACSHDPRFDPVNADELDEIDYELTILSRMKRVLDFEEIIPGTDGVLLRIGYNSGLFLPQVATEQGWDLKTLLEQIGRKAGLNINAYKDPNAELYIFKGMVIH